jgi:DNA polymerase-3 subunit delta'
MRAPRVVEAAPESDRYGELPHPRETSALFGQEEAERALLEAYASGRLPQAWILGGPEGVGKATLAWRFARFLLAHPDPATAAVAAARTLDVAPSHPAARQIVSLSHSDVFLLRREWNDKVKKHFTEIRVDEVRRAIHIFQQAAAGQGYRVCILDSAEDLNRSAANALLKLIEEPPPRSVFLIIAHRPGRIMPTIRSRCRLLHLQPLSPEALGRALDQFAGASDVEPETRRISIERSAGSVREALKRLGGEAARLQERIEALLARLPDVDWRDVHKLADAVSARESLTEYETVIATVFEWLDDAVVRGAGLGPRRLAPYAEVWEKLGAAVRETEALNLDKRPLILSLFADLANATRASRG